MSFAIACDYIGPKHGSSVHITGLQVAPLVWSTATATATAGPDSQPSVATATVQWAQDASGLVSLIVPEIAFVGFTDTTAPVALSFGPISELPAPEANAMQVGLAHLATSPDVSTQTQTRLQIDKTLTISFAGLADGASYVVASNVLKYQVNPRGNWTRAGEATATEGPVSAPGTATWSIYYSSSDLQSIYISIPRGMSFVGDGTAGIHFSPFAGLPHHPTDMIESKNILLEFITDDFIDNAYLRIQPDGTFDVVRFGGGGGFFVNGYTYIMNEYAGSYRV